MPENNTSSRVTAQLRLCTYAPAVEIDKSHFEQRFGSCSFFRKSFPSTKTEEEEQINATNTLSITILQGKHC